MTSKSLAAGTLLGLALGFGGAAQAADYCTIPYLYATNIRSACEQLGARGMATLYESNRFIEALRHPGLPVAVPAAAARAGAIVTKPAA